MAGHRFIVAAFTTIAFAIVSDVACSQVVRADFVRDSAAPPVNSSFFQLTSYQDVIEPAPIPPASDNVTSGNSKAGNDGVIYEPLPVEKRGFVPSDPFLYNEEKAVERQPSISDLSPVPLDEPITSGDSVPFPEYSPGFQSIGCGECSPPVYCRPRCLSDECNRVITAYAGATIMSRSGLNNRLLVRNPFDMRQNISGDDFDFDFGSGSGSGTEAALTVHRLLSSVDVELRYLSTGDIADQQTTNMAGTLLQLQTSSPINVFGPRRVTTSFQSRLQSMEANFRFRYGGGWHWLSYVAGFRYLQLSERLNLGLTDTTGLTAAEAMSSRTTNRLAGFQIGMDKSLAGNWWYYVDAYWRAGIYGNSHDQFTSVTTPAGFFASNSNSNSAFAGEIGIKSRVRVTGCLSVVANYQVLFLDGVATAEDQPSATNIAGVSSLNANGSATFHGATVGAEFVY